MAKYDDTDGVWRTIGGRRVFIREGQSLSDAMIKSGKFKNLRSAYKKQKEKDFEEEDKKFEDLKKLGELNDENKEDIEKARKDLVNKYRENKENYGIRNREEQKNKYAIDEYIEKNKATESTKDYHLKKALGEDVTREEVEKRIDEIKKEEKPKERKALGKSLNEIKENVDNDKNNAVQEKLFGIKDKAKTNDWKSQIEKNNAQTEKDVTNIQNKINEYRTKSAQSDNAIERYQYLKEADRLQNDYYERFRENERANAKIKVEEPNEKYIQVDAHAGYKDKFNQTWGEDGQSDKVVSAKMYTNDEFMEHLEDSNWHSERRQLLDANLTNEQLSYIKDKTKVSAWGVENLNGKEQVSKLIEEAKSKKNSMTSSLQRKAYQKYLKEHPNSNMTLEEFKKSKK